MENGNTPANPSFAILKWGNMGYTFHGHVFLIRKTSLCNKYPLIPHFYIAKLWCAGVYMFLFVF